MAKLPTWLPQLLQSINQGLISSPWLADLENEHLVLVRGRQICLTLWPFIRSLPENIAQVRLRLPAGMESAKKLLDRLADDERQYQSLFIQQFALAGISHEAAALAPVPPATADLCLLMSSYCRDGTFAEGIYAIIAAELAATAYARQSYPIYSRYFFQVARESYGKEEVESGLAWLHLHATTHTRHALWMNRMLLAISENASGYDKMPLPVIAVSNAVFRLWECPVHIFLAGDGKIVEPSVLL